RRIALPVCVNMRSEPAEESCERTLGNLLLKRMSPRVGCNELGRVEAADRIGRKITEHPAGPMTVLEHTLEIGLRVHADKISALLVPRATQLRHLQIARDECLFKFVTQNDVEVIRHLVRARSVC